MKLIPILALAFSILASAAEPDAEGFYELFNGKDITGWKESENPGSFKVIDGELVTAGPRAHLFYVGDVNGAKFKDFHAKLKVMTKANANAGFYFHTEFCDKGWPRKGFEAQINATHKDQKKSGGLYGIADVMNTAPHKDGEWFDYDIIVKGKTVILTINGKQTSSYTEPADKTDGKKLDTGTIAIQCHDPKSEVRFKSIRIKPL